MCSRNKSDLGNPLSKELILKHLLKVFGSLSKISYRNKEKKKT